MESKKKSPYEPDLEVMDRKPPITPKVGDWVKIKSKEWYKKWKDSYGTVPVRFAFMEEMKEHCGRIYKIRAIPSIEHFYIDELRYTWSMEMFEQVYPQEEYTVSKTFLGDIVTPISKGSTAMEAIQDKEGVSSSANRSLFGCNPQEMLDKTISSVKVSIDELIKTGVMSCVVPDDLVLRTQSKQGVAVKTLSKPETKLRIINTNQLIKIDKL
ncbi:MAG: hypothetical protein IJY59_10010 [Bacteroidaceae bacterium]|nr:hypothetical protein [Bacteroidaceae bacterium]